MPENQTTAVLSEKLANLLDKQEVLAGRLESIAEKLDELLAGNAKMEARIAVLEARNGHKLETLTEGAHQVDKRLIRLEDARDSYAWSVGRAIDWTAKIVIGLALSWLIYKIGLRP